MKHIRDISEDDLILEGAGADAFTKGKYKGRDVMAKRLKHEGEIPTQLRNNKSQFVVNYLEIVRVKEDTYLLYRPFTQTLDDFLKKNEGVLVEYGRDDKKSRKVFRLSEKARTVVRSAINIVYCAHENYRTHCDLMENIFVMEEHIYEGREAHTTYYAVCTNNFIKHDVDKKTKKTDEKLTQLMVARDENWNQLGSLLKNITGYHHNFEQSRLDFETHNLIEVLCGSELVNFKSEMAVHSPCLWTNLYRLSFDKWAFLQMKDEGLIFKKHELFEGGSWKNHIGKGIVHDTIDTADAKGYGVTQEDLVRFIRNLSKHPEGFRQFNAARENCRDVFEVIKWRFPKYHVLLVRKCIKERKEDFKRGLKFKACDSKAARVRKSVPASAAGSSSAQGQLTGKKRKR